MATWRHFGIALLATLPGCAAVPPPPDAPVTVPSATIAPRPVDLPSDRAPVEQPASVVLVGRLQRSALTKLLGDHPMAMLARAPISYLVPSLAAALDGQVMADSPLELAASIRSVISLGAHGPRAALSIPLGSFEQALSTLREEARAGRIELRPRSSGVFEVVVLNSASEPCWLATSSGSSPARLVVGTDGEALEELAPYLARGLPQVDLGTAPIAFEAWPSRLASDLGDSLRGLVPLFLGVPGSDDIAGEALDWMADASRLQLTATEEGGSIVVTIAADLASQRSWVSRTLGSYAPTNDLARSMFARLPVDSEMAWFSSTPDPARMQEARQALGRWLQEGFGVGASPTTVDLIARTFLPRTAWVYAQGDASGVDALYTRSTGQGLWQRTLSTFGWHVLGFDEPARQLEPALDAGMQAYNTGDLRSLAYRQLPTLCAGLGKIAKRKAPKGLPAGSVLYEMKMPAAFFDDCMRHYGAMPQEPGPDESLVVVMVPDGGRTWIGFGPQGSPSRLREVRDPSGRIKATYGPQENRMVDRMAALVQGQAGGLVHAPGLEPLSSPSTRIGGFVTAAGVGGLVRFLTMREHYRWERMRVERLPGRGTARIPFAIEVQPTSPARAVGKLWLAPTAWASVVAMMNAP
ncbi:MAG: hypothetical protein HY898_17075 [Deltaproteobacteria bacterium]|nr:hypothetical protein [Deltaproteobacteria bacterium]